MSVGIKSKEMALTRGLPAHPGSAAWMPQGLQSKRVWVRRSIVARSPGRKCWAEGTRKMGLGQRGEKGRWSEGPGPEKAWDGGWAEGLR